MRVERLMTLIEERLGMACADWQRARLVELLASRLGSRVGSHGDSPSGIEGEEEETLSRADLQILIEAVGIGETYFFREPAHFTVLAETVLPERIRQIDSTRPLRILSAGCSTGEEAYSLAITLAERWPDLANGRAAVLGIDASAAAVRRARRARYSRWALRAMPPEFCDRYLRREGEDYQLVDSIRAAVRFEEGNIMEPDLMLLPPGSLDVVFCRNVLIYFSERAMRTAVSRLAEALAPGGFLFLGHSETLRGISSDFDQEHSRDTLFYRRRSGSGMVGSGSGSFAALPSTGSPPLSAAPSSTSSSSSSSASWFESIHRSAERVAQLTSTRTPSAPAAPPPDPTPPRGSTFPIVFMPVLGLIESDQPDKALDLLGPMAANPAQRATATLITAALYYSQSRIEEAKQASQRLIDSGAHTSEAQYLQGLCFEHVGERDRALRSYQEAVRLDPGFAMAKLRLGTLQRRAGLQKEARHLLRQALAQLTQERHERLLLFGGGFQRPALLSLCRAELRALGVEP